MTSHFDSLKIPITFFQEVFLIKVFIEIIEICVCVCVCVCARAHARMCAHMLSHVLTLCNPVDCSLLGSSVHGIFQARILEWVAISYSRGSSRTGMQPRSPALKADSLRSEPPGKPCVNNTYLYWGIEV